MNIDEVERLGVTLQTKASHLEQVLAQLGGLVASTSWVGADAARFKGPWWDGHRSRLQQIVHDLHGFGQSALNNASEQRNASGEAGAGAGSPCVLAGDPSVPSTPAGLEARYAANEQLMRDELQRIALLPDPDGTIAERMITYATLLHNGADVLYFDPSIDAGEGRIAVVSGDLASATKIAIQVPGISSDITDAEEMVGDAERLLAHSRGGTAVISWIGYDTPSGVSDPHTLIQTRAAMAAPLLKGFVDEVRSSNPGAGITVIAHSYGTVATTYAAAEGMQADRVILIGSPGVPATASDFNASVYVASTSDDLVVNGAAMGGGYGSNSWHGMDPRAPEFGATDVNYLDGGGHSDYYSRDDSLEWMANIVDPERDQWVRADDGGWIGTY